MTREQTIQRLQLKQRNSTLDCHTMIFYIIFGSTFVSGDMAYFGQIEWEWEILVFVNISLSILISVVDYFIVQRRYYYSFYNRNYQNPVFLTVYERWLGSRVSDAAALVEIVLEIYCLLFILLFRCLILLIFRKNWYHCPVHYSLEHHYLYIYKFSLFSIFNARKFYIRYISRYDAKKFQII